MKIFTYSVVIGFDARCNAACPYCVAHQTAHYDKHDGQIDLVRLRKGAQLALQGGATTLLLTGKGEPTLWPDQISIVLNEIGHLFPIVELQTNGLRLAELADIPTGKDTTPVYPQSYLNAWKSKGLTTIALSVVHWDNAKNQILMPKGQEYPDLAWTVGLIQSAGFTVRLCVIMLGRLGYISGYSAITKMIDWCRDNGVDQLTMRPVYASEGDSKAAKWSRDNQMKVIDAEMAYRYVDKLGIKLLDLPHGATVYDVDGQNVCMSNCLTLDTDPERVRQIIYCTDGKVRYDWRYPGAILF